MNNLVNAAIFVSHWQMQVIHIEYDTEHRHKTNRSTCAYT